MVSNMIFKCGNKFRVCEYGHLHFSLHFHRVLHAFIHRIQTIKTCRMINILVQTDTQELVGFKCPGEDKTENA